MRRVDSLAGGREKKEPISQVGIGDATPDLRRTRCLNPRHGPHTTPINDRPMTAIPLVILPVVLLVIVLCLALELRIALRTIANHRTIMTGLERLQVEVAKNTSVIESARVLIVELKSKLDEAISSGDPAALQALSDQLGANDAALAAAVAANTPAESGTVDASPPEPTPPVTA